MILAGSISLGVGCATSERAPIPEPRPVDDAPVESRPVTAVPATPRPEPETVPEVDAPPEPVVRAVFPGVRLVRDARGRQFVEVDSFVPIMDDPDAPDVYLELIMCRRDTRDHEVLVATDAQASHVHAALLMLGLEDGHPGYWSVADGELVPHAPEGAGVRVELVVERDGELTADVPAAWVRNLKTDERLPDVMWVFAGSAETDHPVFPYSADGSGNVIGLTTFGDEVVAYPAVISPEAAMDEPVWVADFDRVPPFGTEVVVRLIPEEPEE